MEDLFNLTTFECSRLITQRYSTSFTLGIKTLHKRFHFPIYAIYGFVRYADEIVDTFHDRDKRALIDSFENDTYKAIKEGISLNPVLHSFQMVVNQYDIDLDLIKAFLHSMKMDLDQDRYQQDGYEEYIYGSAEVVGLMCLAVFCEGNKEEYRKLLPSAKRLGAAFQKVNFLRDIKSDFEERGRVYFPGVDFKDFSKSHKQKIEEDIQADFDAALVGIKQLPDGARMGVYLAYRYYLNLFKKIRHASPDRILSERVRIADGYKIILLVQTYLSYRLHFI